MSLQSINDTVNILYLLVMTQNYESRKNLTIANIICLTMHLIHYEALYISREMSRVMTI